jgi:hypothetical protein
MGEATPHGGRGRSPQLAQLLKSWDCSRLLDALHRVLAAPRATARKGAPDDDVRVTDRLRRCHTGAEKRWIILTADGWHVSIGRHADPSGDEIEAAAGKL